MELRDLHRWDLSPKEAIAVQRRLASQVVCEGKLNGVRRIAGVDCSLDRIEKRPDGRPSGRGIGAVVVLSYPELELIDAVAVDAPLTFPYVPGLLSFRETPVLREAFRRIAGPIDLLLVDGQGYAHPRRFGIACHLGLLLDVPAIGCAKSRLLGEHGAPAEAAGSRADLLDKGDLIGSVLRTRTGVNPLFISSGHRISLPEAEAWVIRCCLGYRLPEPTRLAHLAAAGRLPQP